MHPYIYGGGKLGWAVKQLLEERKIYHTADFVGSWHANEKTAEPDVVIYCGKGGESFTCALKYCERYNLPFINASTDLGDLKPKEPHCLFIDAPNASLPMVAFMQAFTGFAQTLLRQKMKLSIIESHQATKKSVSGTAKSIVQKLEISEEIIKFERDGERQLILGVPQEYLDSHAYHFFTFVGNGVEIEVKTKIHGRRTYAEGLLAIASLALSLKDSSGHKVISATSLLSSYC